MAPEANPAILHGNMEPRVSMTIGGEDEQRRWTLEGASAHPGGERDVVISRLTAAFAEDQLTMEELERRLSVAYQAADGATLRQLVAGLPPSTRVGTVDLQPVRISSILSSVERAGPLALAPRLEIRAILGNVEMDFREAMLLPGVTEIVLDVVLGSVTLELPAGVAIDNHSDVLLSSFEGPRRPAAGLSGTRSHVVRFTGRSILGSVVVKQR